jgi:hypothetical protein
MFFLPCHSRAGENPSHDIESLFKTWIPARFLVAKLLVAGMTYDSLIIHVFKKLLVRLGMADFFQEKIHRVCGAHRN